MMLLIAGFALGSASQAYRRCAIEATASPLFEKNSQEEYDASPDLFVRTNITFGTYDTDRQRMYREWGLDDPMRPPSVYAKEINVRKLSDATDYTDFGFTRIKLPTELFAKLRSLMEDLMATSRIRITPTWPIAERKRRDKHAKALEEYVMKERALAGEDISKADKEFKSKFGIQQDTHIADLLNGYASDALNHRDGPRDYWSLRTARGK